MKANETGVSDAELGRIRWQCRRGIKEVEVVLIPYFERFFLSSGPEKQQMFLRLLSCTDVEMFEWFTYRSKPEEEELEVFVAEVLEKLQS